MASTRWPKSVRSWLRRHSVMLKSRAWMVRSDPAPSHSPARLTTACSGRPSKASSSPSQFSTWPRACSAWTVAPKLAGLRQKRRKFRPRASCPGGSRNMKRAARLASSSQPSGVSVMSPAPCSSSQLAAAPIGAGAGGVSTASVEIIGCTSDRESAPADPPSVGLQFRRPRPITPVVEWQWIRRPAANWPASSSTTARRCGATCAMPRRVVTGARAVLVHRLAGTLGFFDARAAAGRSPRGGPGAGAPGDGVRSRGARRRTAARGARLHARMPAARTPSDGRL